ncbi:hypothetical protein Pyrfu_0943 [Pyrolobus fumarii 1A]|uniref:Uncharacterized protein n=1 Tax=Pyrolobus fumarii (strain DSM 11204 / 1A) TaxID=694429 RepID=G0EEB8_PYRF1|nr:hypothetical protein Pyrfu_0943 [Pyrolobus fumarii 1A]
MWIPYARLAANLYYELYISPRASGCRKLLGFTRITLEPKNGKPRGILAKPSRDPHTAIREALASCRGNGRASWRIEVRGVGSGVWAYARVIKERLLFPSRLPRVRVNPEDNLETSIASLLREDLEKIVKDARISGIYYRPFSIEASGTLRDITDIDDNHDEILSRLLKLEPHLKDLLTNLVT